MMTIKRHFAIYLLTHALVLTTLIVSLFLSWRITNQFDYFYPFLYEQISIENHINRFAPKNSKGHQHFEHTTNEERLALFSEIVYAINHDGEGLRQLTYSPPNHPSHKLLTEPEASHLEDVAKLFDTIFQLGLIVLAIWILLLVLGRLWKTFHLTFRKIIYASLLQALVIGLFLAIATPYQVFYQLHKLIFPPNSKWFYYYHESLMATLMKAPDLFGYIAATISLISLPIGLFLAMFLIIVCKKRTTTPPQIS